jgi:hypothetical protein
MKASEHILRVPEE